MELRNCIPDGVIAGAIKRAGLETLYLPRSSVSLYEPCPIVKLDWLRVEVDDDFRYACQCLQKGLFVSKSSPTFTMHFSRYIEGVQHPLKPMGVMIESRSFGLWIGQCPECMTIYVAERELR